MNSNTQLIKNFFINNIPFYCIIKIKSNELNHFNDLIKKNLILIKLILMKIIKLLN